MTIHVPGPLRGYCAGVAELSVAAPTVRAALDQLEHSQAVLYRNVCDETGAVRQADGGRPDTFAPSWSTRSAMASQLAVSSSRR